MRQQWFDEARFGMFVHFGLYSGAARHEWVQNYERLTAEEYRAYFDHFDPDLFDATVLMHPLIPFEPRVQGSLAGRRILVTAGRRDPICPPVMTTRLEAYLRADGADVTVEWHEGGHEVRPNEIEAARRFLAGASLNQGDGA